MTSIGLITLEVAYIAVLSAGLFTLPSPTVQVQDPWFTAMELLILAIAPGLVVLMAAMHYTVPAQKQVFSILALAFVLCVSILTVLLHFSIITLSREEAFLAPPWSTIIFPFHWPFVAYAIDIAAWDIFWPLSLGFSAFSMGQSRLEKWTRYFMLLSATLSALGLIGVVTGDMNHRNIGIIGYVPVFILILVFLSARFAQIRRNGSQPG